jgi:uncharacterized protein (TIGR00106 family)
MKVVADFCLIPLDVGLSLSPYIVECEKILKTYSLELNLHGYGTNIEGEWDDVFEAIKKCHEKIHEMGALRISSTLRFGTRTDKEQTIQEKIKSVQDKLES